MDAGVLRTILQLPRPRRQAVNYYPAVIETGAAHSGHIRLASIRDIAPGPGGLSQSEVLRVVFRPPDGRRSMDVEPKALCQANQSDFTPGRYLVNKGEPEDLPLARYAQVIRCQLSRTRVESEASAEHSFRCREVTLSDLDKRTGFLEERQGQWVTLKPPYSSINDHLLQKNDILISFRSSEAHIGRVGFVAVNPAEPTICGQSVCIIRVVDKINPAWLYHYLRGNEVRQQVLGYSTGGRMLTVNTGDIGKLPIPLPDPAHVDECSKRHDEILRYMAEIQGIYFKIEDEMKKNEDTARDFGHRQEKGGKGLDGLLVQGSAETER